LVAPRAARDTATARADERSAKTRERLKGARGLNDALAICHDLPANDVLSSAASAGAAAGALNPLCFA